MYGHKSEEMAGYMVVYSQLPCDINIAINAVYQQRNFTARHAAHRRFIPAGAKLGTYLIAHQRQLSPLARGNFTMYDRKTGLAILEFVMSGLPMRFIRWRGKLIQRIPYCAVAASKSGFYPAGAPSAPVTPTVAQRLPVSWRGYRCFMQAAPSVCSQRRAEPIRLY